MTDDIANCHIRVNSLSAEIRSFKHNIPVYWLQQTRLLHYYEFKHLKPKRGEIHHIFESRFSGSKKKFQVERSTLPITMITRRALLSSN